MTVEFHYCLLTRHNRLSCLHEFTFDLESKEAMDCRNEVDDLQNGNVHLILRPPTKKIYSNANVEGLRLPWRNERSLSRKIKNFIKKTIEYHILFKKPDDAR